MRRMLFRTVVAVAIPILPLLFNCSRPPQITGPYAEMILAYRDVFTVSGRRGNEALTWLSMAGPDAAVAVGPFLLNRERGDVYDACKVLDSLDESAAGALPWLIKALKHRQPDNCRYDERGPIRLQCVRILGDIGQPAIKALRASGLAQQEGYAGTLARIAMVGAGDEGYVAWLLEDMRVAEINAACGPAIVEVLCRGPITQAVSDSLFGYCRRWVEEKMTNSSDDAMLYETVIAVTNQLHLLDRDITEVGPLVLAMANKSDNLGAAACSSMVSLGGDFARWLAANEPDAWRWRWRGLARMGQSAAPVVPLIIGHLADTASRYHVEEAAHLLDSIGRRARRAGPVLRKHFMTEWEHSSFSGTRLTMLARALASVDPVLAVEEFRRCAQTYERLNDNQELALVRGLAACGTHARPALDWLVQEAESESHKLENDFVYEVQKALFSVAPGHARAQEAMLTSMLGFARFGEEFTTLTPQRLSQVRSMLFSLDPKDLRTVRANARLADAFWENNAAPGSIDEMSRDELDSLRAFLTSAGAVDLADGDGFIAYVEQMGIDSVRKTFAMLGSLGRRAEATWTHIAQIHDRWTVRLLALELLLRLEAIQPSTAGILPAIVQQDQGYLSVAAAACLMKNGLAQRLCAPIVLDAVSRRDPTMQYYGLMGLARSGVPDSLLPSVRQALQHNSEPLWHAAARALRVGTGDKDARLKVFHESFANNASHTAKAACAATCLLLDPADSLALRAEGSHGCSDRSSRRYSVPC